MTEAPEKIWRYNMIHGACEKYEMPEMVHFKEGRWVLYSDHLTAMTNRDDLPPKVKALVFKNGVADCGLFRFVISRQYPKSSGKYTLSVWQDGYFKETTHASEKLAADHAELIFKTFILGCLEGIYQ